MSDWSRLRLACLTMLVALARANSACADAHQQARVHFDAGTLAFEQQRFADAASEFERAYREEPAWQVLYNLGTVYVVLGEPVKALDAFERYLQQADASADPERRRAVRAEIAKQRAKSARLDPSVNDTASETQCTLGWLFGAAGLVGCLVRAAMLADPGRTRRNTFDAAQSNQLDNQPRND